MKLSLLFLTLAIPAMSMAGPTELIPQEDVVDIVQKFQARYEDAFNRRDAKAMAALLTENATLQNEWGDITRGRANIESLVTRLMAHLPVGTTLEDTSLVSQAIGADVIVSQGTSNRVVPGVAPAQMFFTRVLVLEEHQWKLAATQIARPSAMPKPAAAPTAQ